MNQQPYLRAYDRVLDSLQKRYERRLRCYNRTRDPKDLARLDEARLAMNAAFRIDEAARSESRMLSQEAS